MVIETPAVSSVVGDLIFEFAPDAILVVRADGTIVRANPQAENLFSYPPGALVGKLVEVLIPHRFAAGHVKQRKGYCEAPHSRRMGVGLELFGRRSDGSEVPVEVALGPVGDSDPLQVLCIIRDITERKETERALRRARDELEERVQERTADLARANRMLRSYATRLERSNRELQDFVFVASHDLQEPLRKIHAFGDRLRSRLAGQGRETGLQLDAQSADYLSRMQHAAVRMQNLIQDLASISRITTRAQPFAQVDLNVGLREVLSDLEVAIEQAHAKIEAGPLPTIEADATQMRQLLQNLISNALKFRAQDRQPVIRIASGPASPPEGSGEGPWITLTVSDNGIGFDPQYRERIFGLFQRLHGRGEYEGSGIGLAICRKISERHGGKISATAALGEGAAFTVLLPVRQSGTEDPS